MKKLFSAIVLIAISSSAFAQMNNASASKDNWAQVLDQWLFLRAYSVTDEMTGLKIKFIEEVSDITVDSDYSEWVKSDALKKLKENIPFVYPAASQYFVFSDRNPEKQLVMVGYYSPAADQIEIIGFDKCSTGNPAHGGDYHFTPTGIFANTLECFSFRAAGTKNSNGWRGYGRKNCRVWDFGYQSTTKPIRGKEQWREIRLLMHATDPDGGEPKLGSPQSKGCVRITAKLNRFLDFYGIIDAEYEADTQRKSVQWVLLKDRQPVSEAGKYLLVGDSITLK